MPTTKTLQLSALAAGGLVALALFVPAALGAQDPDPVVTIQIPEVDMGARTLGIRGDLQLRSRSEFGVYHDFQFVDRLQESGVRFVHQVTEDNLKAMKPVHYDHGNGVSVADVDGDGLYDIYFLTQIGGNQLWKNLGGGRFRDVTAEAGIAVADRVSVAGSFADWDNDGDPDLFVTTVRMGNIFFRNEGGGRFKDVTDEVGMAHVGHSSGSVFFDYDLDGWLDCLLTNVGVYTVSEKGPGPYYIGREDAFFGHKFPERTEVSLLYRNLGDGRMQEVSEATGLLDPGWSGDAAFTDLNRDGYPDLYVLNMQGEDHYWENLDGERFRERAKELFPKSPWGAMGISFLDYNNDGLMDLLLTDMHSDMTERVPVELEKTKARVPQAGPDDFIYGNALYKNLGDAKFVEVSETAGVENYWPWGVSVGDLNADGYTDLFLTSSMSYPFRYGVNTLLLNDRGEVFRDSEFILGVEPRRGDRTHMPWFVLDCSGADQGHEHCEDQEGKVEILGAIGTRGAVIFDLDDDGDLDIATLEHGAPPQLLISDLAERRAISFLKIELVGHRSNRDGLGARVTVSAGGRQVMQLHDGKSGYLAQSSLPLYFGLGDAERAERVEVLWPSGERQVIETGIPVNDLMVIEEPVPSPAAS